MATVKEDSLPVESTEKTSGVLDIHKFDSDHDTDHDDHDADNHHFNTYNYGTFLKWILVVYYGSYNQQHSTECV